jgi:hypothetical protein
MSIERIFYCDWRECSANMQTAGSSASPFITVIARAGHSLHFCDWDCLLKHAAEKPPTETIPLAPSAD